MEPLALVFGLCGAVWGVASDRISARWPAHEDGSVRRLDWRTPIVAIFGALALAAVPIRFGDAAERALFGAVFATLVLMMATDLDQKLLPDVLTLPIVVVGAAVLVWGGDSLVNRQPAWLAIAAAIGHHRADLPDARTRQPHLEGHVQSVLDAIPVLGGP